MKTELKQELYKTVTAALIEQMEQGVAIWQKPWVTSKAYQPQNGASGRLYNGFNRMYLGFMQMDILQSDDPRWFTFTNVKDLGAKIKKGSKSTIVVYNAPAIKEVYDESDVLVETKTWWNVKYYKVFHASQCEGLPEYDANVEVPVQPDSDEDYPGITMMHDWCDANLALNHGSNVACYVPYDDAICMPDLGMFKRQSWYAQTLAHEIIHATGSETRLNRLEKAGFGTDKYAKEELVAEFGSAMLCGSLDIPADMDQSAAYLKGWAQRCKDDPSLLISAANMAEKAVDFVMEDAYAVA